MMYTRIGNIKKNLTICSKNGRPKSVPCETCTISLKKVAYRHNMFYEEVYNLSWYLMLYFVFLFIKPFFSRSMNFVVLYCLISVFFLRKRKIIIPN